jgi:hypothetical protein
MSACPGFLVLFAWSVAASGTEPVPAAPSKAPAHAPVAVKTPLSPPKGAGIPETRRADTTAPRPQAPDSAERRSESVERLHLELDTLGVRIEELKASAQRAGAKVKKETKGDLEALERARAGIAARLDTLGRVTVAGWQKLRERAGREMDSLKAEVDRVRKKAKE